MLTNVKKTLDFIQLILPEANCGKRIVNSGTRIVNYGTRIVNSGTRIVNSGTRIVNSGTRIVNSGTRIVNSGTRMGLGKIWNHNTTIFTVMSIVVYFIDINEINCVSTL